MHFKSLCLLCTCEHCNIEWKVTHCPVPGPSGGVFFVCLFFVFGDFYLLSVVMLVILFPYSSGIFTLHPVRFVTWSSLVKENR